MHNGFGGHDDDVVGRSVGLVVGCAHEQTNRSLVSLLLLLLLLLFLILLSNLLLTHPFAVKNGTAEVERERGVFN